MTAFIISYLLNRATEASTWSGLALFLTGTLGWHLNPDITNSIVPLGMALAGILHSVLPDKLTGTTPAATTTTATPAATVTTPAATN
jgi:hypothetical protein